MAVALQILASGFAAGAVYGLVARRPLARFPADRRRALRLRRADRARRVRDVARRGRLRAGLADERRRRSVPARARDRPRRDRRRERRLVLPRDRAVPRSRLGDRLGRRVARRRVRRPNAARRLLRPARVCVPGPAAIRRIADDGFWHVGGATIQLRSIFVAAAALALAGPAARCCSARGSGARSRRSRRTSTRPCSSACRSPASSASLSRSPACGPAWRRSSPRRRRRSTSMPPRATASTGSWRRRSCGSTRGARCAPASRSA